MKVQKDIAIAYLLVSGLSIALNILVIVGLIERRIGIIGFIAVLMCMFLSFVVKAKKDIKTSIMADIEILFEGATNIMLVRAIFIAYIAIWGTTYILIN